MPGSLDSAGIARSFSDAAATYDGWAEPQRRIAERLRGCLPDVVPGDSILDAGCGTGLFTVHLRERYPGARILGIDLAPGMVAYCAHHWQEDPRATFEVADAEDFSTGERFGLIASNCCLQWFRDVPNGIARLTRCLCPGGWFAASVPVKGSLQELGTSYETLLNAPVPGMEFRPPETYVKALENPGIRLNAAECGTIEVMYDSAMDVLRSFKGIGATFRTRPGYKPLTPGQLAELVRVYEERFSRGGRVPVTYRTLYIAGERTQ